MNDESTKHNLSHRHKAFADNYCVTFSPKKAAEACGYQGKNPSSYGYQLMQREDIKAYIDEELTNKKKSMQRIPFEAILTELVEMAMDGEANPRVRLKAMEILKNWEITGKTPTANADMKPFVDALMDKTEDLWGE